MENKICLSCEECNFIQKMTGKSSYEFSNYFKDSRAEMMAELERMKAEGKVTDEVIDRVHYASTGFYLQNFPQQMEEYAEFRKKQEERYKKYLKQV